jgi:UDP-N-acetylmuramate-alanine ligase
VGKQLVEKVRERNENVHYILRENLSEFLSQFLKKDDVLVTMGAGDITQVGPEVLTLLGEKR